MIYVDELALQTGIDIPFSAARVIIHQPRIKEIAYITQKSFWSGCQFLKFDKEILEDEVRFSLSNKTNFDIIMSMIQDKNLESQEMKINTISVLSLIFPAYQIKVGRQAIQLKHHQTQEVSEINNQNFEQFKEILNNMFCLVDKSKDYNPGNQLAKRIADKFKQAQRRKAKLASEASNPNKIAILSRYLSILAVGQQKDKNELANYTVFQLMDQFNRFTLKLHYDAWMGFKLAGASDLQDPEDWLKDLSQKKDDVDRDIIHTF